MNNRGRAAARSGVAAVMGAKKLKAIVAKGEIEIPLADRAAVYSVRRKYLQELKRPDIKHFIKYGTIDHVAASVMNNGFG